MPKFKNRSLFRRQKLSGSPKRFTRTRLSGWEQLEERVLLATLLVVNTDDSGAGSLRQAILDANGTTEPDTIVFNIGFGVQTISPTSPLPTITSPVLIDGTTQPGCSGTPMIELSGASAGSPSVHGLHIAAGNSTVKGLVINRFSGVGLLIDTAGGNVIQNNYVGTNVAGNAARANASNGIAIRSSGNQIGGVHGGEGNLVSGNNAHGIVVQTVAASDNVIEGNRVGVDATGTTSLGNSIGILMFQDASRNRIGGTQVGSENVISGNRAQGIQFSDAHENVVQGNLIGTDSSGLQSLGNRINGVRINNGSTGNRIGGTQPGAKNVISGNLADGVRLESALQNVLEGNLIGTDASGLQSLGNGGNGVAIVSGAVGNRIGDAELGAGNVISGNVARAIEIVGIGSTDNVVEGNLIGVDASGASMLGNGKGIFVWQGASRNRIGGAHVGAVNVISANRDHGIQLDNAHDNIVQGNRIGTDPAGVFDFGNRGAGVVLSGGASGNVVGGTATAARNVISGNDTFGGIYILHGNTSNNVVEGNYVGTNAAGTAAIPNNSAGVRVENSYNNRIGGVFPRTGNLISGNTTGIVIAGSAATGNVVQGNFIGTDVTGTVELGNTRGIVISNAPRNTIGGASLGARNVISGNNLSGLLMDGSGASENVVIGNYIGTDATGDAALGNGSLGVPASSHGITLSGGARLNRIGTDGDGDADGAEGNLISGNVSDGIKIAAGSEANIIAGNYIGTNVDGSSALGNGRNGIFVERARSNRLGTDGDGMADDVERNIISGNAQYGILLGGSFNSLGGDGTTDNFVSGNFIGTDSEGSIAIGNGLDGVRVGGGAQNNSIGGVAGLGNRIAFNSGSGVVVVGDATSAASIRGNQIYDNGTFGIDLAPIGVTPNDPGDADSGPNNLQNFPLLTGALIGSSGTSITGTLNSTAGQTFFIDFYANPDGTGDPSGYGEGQRYLGSTTLTTDAGGNGNFAFLAVGVASREVITATATDADGNTSEFSLNVLANTPPLANAGGPYTVPEGGGVLLDASGSFDPDQDPDTLVYEWDFDHDGLSFTVDASGIDSFFDASLLDGETTRTVAVRVTDAGGLSDVDTAIVTIQNVAPTVGISGSARALAGGTLTVTLSATDPSLADQNAGFTFHIDWDGDGTIDQTVHPADSPVVDHTFVQAGFFTVHVTATDKDGATSPVVTHDVLIVQPVEIDVRDSVNLQSEGVIAVTIFSTSDFDASSVNVNSVAFAGAFAVQHAFEDVNKDGTLDLVLHFRTQETNLRQVYEQLLAEDIREDGTLDANKQEAKVILTGETVDAVFFEGADDLSLFLSSKSLRDLLEDLAWRGLI